MKHILAVTPGNYPGDRRGRMNLQHWVNAEKAEEGEYHVCHRS
jgi:hypothetical protein